MCHPVDLLGETYKDKVIMRLHPTADGYLVTVLEDAYPALAYRVIVKDKSGEPTFTLNTGTGTKMKVLACSIAEAISTGMLTIKWLH